MACCGKNKARGLKLAQVAKANNVTRKIANRRKVMKSPKSTRRSISSVGTVTASDTDTLVNIKYSGRKNLHYVVSPTRGGFYGYYRDGATFAVLKEDQESVPEIFVLIDQPEEPEEAGEAGEAGEPGEAGEVDIDGDQ